MVDEGLDHVKRLCVIHVLLIPEMKLSVLGACLQWNLFSVSCPQNITFAA